MIKDDMTLALSIDTATLKATNSAIMSATDAQVMPYSIGYVPFEMLEKSAIFRKFSYGLTSAIPNNIFMYSPNAIGEATKGVPFVYTIKAGTEGSMSNVYYNGSAWVQLPFANNNANMRLLHSFDTDYYINNIANFGANINGITLRFRYIETAYNQEGWQGDAFESVKMPKTFNVTATITPTPNIALTFSQNITSQYNGHVYTIDQTIFTKMYENGLAELDGGTYTYNGTDYSVKLYIFIDLAAIDRTYPNGNALGFGTMCIENVRYSEFDINGTTYFQQDYNASSNKWLTGNAELFVNNYPSQYGYYVTISQTGISVFRSAVMQWINMCVSGGYNLDDIKILICTALPAYKIGGSYYVAEFDNDYVITGKLIPYAQAKTWQTFINPDNNVFDYNDIPEPPGPGENDDAFSGEEFAPIVNYRIGTAAGFITLYALTENQLAAFGAALWSTPAQDTFWQSIGVMLATDLSVDPAHILDYIVSIRKYPLNLANLTNIYHTGTPGVYLGRGISGISVGGNVGYLDSYSCDVYGGSEKVPTEFNDFRDYEPYTKVSLYVPFCGTVELTPSQVVGKDIVLQYVIDFSNGVIQANVIVSGEKGLVTLAVLSGKIGADVQATADNQIGQLQKISSIGHSIASTGIRMVAASQTGDSAIDSQLATSAASVSGQNSITGSFLSSVMAHNLNSNEGFSSFSMLTPCIFVERKHFNVPPNYGHTHGYACNVTTTLGDLEGKGFTVCGNVELSGVPATQDELAALEALLQSGVYL